MSVWNEGLVVQLYVHIFGLLETRRIFRISGPGEKHLSKEAVVIFLDPVVGELLRRAENQNARLQLGRHLQRVRQQDGLLNWKSTFAGAQNRHWAGPKLEIAPVRINTLDLRLVHGFVAGLELLDFRCQRCDQERRRVHCNVRWMIEPRRVGGLDNRVLLHVDHAAFFFKEGQNDIRQYVIGGRNAKDDRATALAVGFHDLQVGKLEVLDSLAHEQDFIWRKCGQIIRS